MKECKTLLAPISNGKGVESTEAHARNFLDCVKSRASCNAHVEIGHISTTTTFLENVAHKPRSLLEWNGRAEKFTNKKPPTGCCHISTGRRTSSVEDFE